MDESEVAGSRASTDQSSEPGWWEDLSDDSNFTARRTLPSCLLSIKSAEGAPQSSGPLRHLLKGYEQRHDLESNRNFYFERRLGNVEDGDQDLLYGNLWSFPDHLTQIIVLHWHSSVLSQSEKGEAHDLLIETMIPWVDEQVPAAEEKQGCTTVTIDSERGENKVSLLEIKGNYASTAGQARTMAGKVRQLNNATATKWWQNLFQQLPACKDDKVLQSVLAEIDWLLRGFLSKVWKESAMPE